MINLEWLRTYTTIFECGNITEASKLLHMTQPGVSKHLLALEHHIGKKLFDRTTRKITPTEYGKFLYTQIINPIKSLEKVEHYSSNRTKKELLAIEIGCTSDFFKQELLSKIYLFNMYIVTHFGSEKELKEALEKDVVQLVVGIEKYDAFGYQFKMIKKDDLVLVCSNKINIDPNLEKDEKQLLKWLQKQTWYTYNNELTDIKAFWELNFNEKPKIVPRYILPSYVDIVTSLKTNPGICVLPNSISEKALEEGVIKIPFSSLKPVQQKKYSAHKLKNDSLQEIIMFMEKMEYV